MNHQHHYAEGASNTTRSLVGSMVPYAASSASSGSADRREVDERTPLLSSYQAPVPQSVPHYDNWRYPSGRDTRLSVTALGNPQATDAPTAYQTRMARRLKLESESYLSQSIGTYVSLRPEALESAAIQASGRGPAESEPSRWQSRYTAAPAPTPTQVLANAKEALVRDISQAQVDEETFRSLVKEQKVKDTEDTMEELMFIYGKAMTGGLSEASKGEGGGHA